MNHPNDTLSSAATVEAEPVTAFGFCQTRIKPVKDEIPRTIFVDTIFEMSQEFDVLFLDGPSEIGKSTILDQFCQAHSHSTIALFLDRSSRNGMSSDVLIRDLCGQLYWFVFSEELPESFSPDVTSWNSLIYEAIKRLKRRGDPLFIVIDGISSIPSESSHVLDMLRDILPFGKSPIKIILSDKCPKTTQGVSDKISRSTLRILKLSKDEAKSFLPGCDPADFNSLYGVSDGVPGKLASIRRLLEDGHSPGDLAKDITEKSPNFFSFEWRSVDESNDCMRHVLGIIAFMDFHYTAEEIGQYSGHDTKEIESCIDRLSFLQIDDATKHVIFASEALRRYAAKKLSPYRDAILGKMVDSYMSGAKMSSGKSEMIPILLHKSKRDSQLVDYLNHSKVEGIVLESNSIGKARQVTRLAMQSAANCKLTKDVLRLALQRSALHDLNFFAGHQSEVEAHLSVGSISSAIKIAHAAGLKEDRLQMLVAIARVQHENKLAPPPEIVEEIKRLCSEMDFSLLGDRAWEIAADIMHIDTTLAVDLMQKVSTHKGSEGPAFDQSFARAAAKAIASKSSGDECSEKITRLVKNPSIRGFTGAAKHFVRPMTAQQILDEAMLLTTTRDQVFLLRMWMGENHKSPDSIQVAIRSLELIVSDATYKPTAREFCDLSPGLIYEPDKKKISEAVSAFNVQDSFVKSTGPTEEYVAHRLQLCWAIRLYDENLYAEKLSEAETYIAGIGDSVTKISCLSHLLATKYFMCKAHNGKDKYVIDSYANKTFLSMVESLLSETAEHDQVTESIIRNLSVCNPDLALIIASVLNTERRRDQALVDFIDSALEASGDDIPFSHIAQACAGIIDYQDKDDGIMLILDRIPEWSKIPGFLSKNQKYLLSIYQLVGSMADVNQRCRACCRLLHASQCEDGAFLRGETKNIYALLDSTWESIDQAWMKIDIAFKICHHISKINQDTARDYLERGEKLKNQTIFDTGVTLSTYHSVLYLCSELFIGLTGLEPLSNSRLEPMESLVEKIDSKGHQTLVWTHIGVRFLVKGNQEVAKRIANSKVVPLLSEMNKCDQDFYLHVCSKAVPLVYIVNQTLAENIIKGIPYIAEQRVLYNACRILLLGEKYEEPVDADAKHWHKPKWDSILKCLSVLSGITFDSFLYSIFQYISDIILDKRNRQAFDQSKKSQCSSALLAIVEKSLPDHRNIKHDGYEISCRALALGLIETRRDTWIDLISKAKQIPNISDRALVLCAIADCIQRPTELRDECFKMAEAEIDQITSACDKMDRLRSFAVSIEDHDISRAKAALKKAMSCSIGRADEEVWSDRRDIVDYAYRLDEDFAADLAKIADSDPAREAHGRTQADQMKLLKTRQGLVDDLSKGKPASVDDPKLYPKLAWMIIKCLNSGRAAPVNVNNFNDMLLYAGDNSLRESFPIYDLFVRNVIMKSASSHKDKEIMSYLFDEMTKSLDLITRVAANARNISLKKESAQHPVIDGDALMVRPGDRAQAMNFINRWFRSSVKEYCIICDPYFGPEEMEILLQFMSDKPSCSFIVVTSLSHQTNQGIKTPYDESYKAYWKRNISDQDPPSCDLCVLGIEGSVGMPIHDRWMLGGGVGLRLGTSLNTLGVSKDSELSRIEEGQAKIYELEVRSYIEGKKKLHNERKIHRHIFTI